MSTKPSLDYFETDLVKHAVVLWKLVRRAREPDFDVLRFARDWAFADGVLQQCLGSEQDVISDAALELIQLRARFQHEEPARALKMGAPGAVVVSTPASAPATAAGRTPSASTLPAPEATPADPMTQPARYLKSLR